MILHGIECAQVIKNKFRSNHWNFSLKRIQAEVLHQYNKFMILKSVCPILLEMRQETFILIGCSNSHISLET